MKLGINIDHIATLRNIRKNKYPNLLLSALITEDLNINTITVHLRKDKRHINEIDIKKLILLLRIKLNIEVSIDIKLIKFCSNIKPYSICLVPEKKNELTTLRGLNIINNFNKIYDIIKYLKFFNIKMILFIDCNIKKIKYAIKCKIKIIELYLGKYSLYFKNYIKNKKILKIIKKTIIFCNNNGLKVNIGHNINYYNINKLINLSNIYEINIGHSIISNSIFNSLNKSIYKMKNLINNT